mgnify:CR=1 FL=1
MSFNPNKNNARLSVVYIFDTDKFERYDLYFKPGKYTLDQVSEKLKLRVQIERKDLRYGKRVFILADLQNGSVMAKYFTENKLSLNFSRG